MADEGGSGGQGADGGAQGGQSQAVTLNADNWREFVPPELKEEPSLANIKDVGSLFKGYVNAQRMVGAEKLVVPTGALDTKENWDLIYSKLGRPESPEKYEFKRGELPKGLSWNETMEKGFKDISHEIGLSSRQAQRLYDFYNQAVLTEYQGFMDQEAKGAEEAQRILQETFGADAPKAKELAGKVIGHFAEKAEHKEALAQLMEKVPALQIVLAKVGQSLRESTLHKGDGGGSSFASSPEQAQQIKMDIMTNKENPLNAAYFDKRHPNHAQALDEVLRLNEVILSGQK